MAINFVKNDDIRILRDIEQYYSTQIDEMPMNSENMLIHSHTCTCAHTHTHIDPCLVSLSVSLSLSPPPVNDLI